MGRFVSCATAVVAFGLVSGCSAVQTQQDLYPSYDFRNFSSYHQGRDTRVVVMGDTFGLDPEAFSQRVTAAMQGNHVGRPTNFTTQPGPTANENFRVVMAFNVEPAYLGLCNGQELAPRAAENRTVVQAAWCWEGRQESYVRGWTEATRPGDPKFEELIARTTHELFPPRKDRELMDDDDNGDDGPPV